ncbi:hypothetical protein [Bifidobacterium gallicum]|nr:hypothetical protein [Bifidobacterium gallicum]
MSVYRDKLIKNGVITPTEWGFVDFKIPYLRDYLREHSEHIAYHMHARE